MKPANACGSAPVDARLHENEAELGVLVLAVALEVLAHGHGLLNQVVQILRDLRREACSPVPVADR